jgi:uncharacterized protein YndB with AHSA1/START domain
MSAIRKEMSYPHPPERVWKMLTTPRLLEMWLMQAESFEAKVGCRFRFRTKPAPGFDGIIYCEIVEATPPTRLAYTWASGKMRARPTLVTWTLQPDGTGTRLTLEHGGFRGVGGLLLRTMLGRGWGHKLRDYAGVLLDRMQVADDQPSLVNGDGLLECEPQVKP